MQRAELLSRTRQCFTRSPSRAFEPTGPFVTPSHLFSTTAQPRKVDPESPRFIEIPQPPQPSYPPQPRVKGFLPVPREVFHPRSPNKTSPQYLAATAPEPTAKSDESLSNIPDPDLAERIAWRRRLASTRRHHLREGLVELRRRQDRTKRARGARGALRQAEREAKLYQPQPEDERLTSPTITQAMKQLQIGILPDPDRETRVALKMANFQATMAKQSEDRRRALHSLYMNARRFITDEKKLHERIEEVFVENWDEFSAANKGRGVWKNGPPVSLESLMERLNHQEKGAIRHGTSITELGVERALQLAEELTGGELDRYNKK